MLTQCAKELGFDLTVLPSNHVELKHLTNAYKQAGIKTDEYEVDALFSK